MATTLIIAAFGLIAGSFLSLCAWRLPRLESVAHPGSRCPECRHRLTARENIPLLSYVWQRGRCRACHTGMSWRYPVIEAATAAAWVGSWRRAGSGFEFMREALFLSLLIALAVTDAECRQLPDEATLGGWAAALVFSLRTAPGWRSACAASFGLAGVLALVAVGYQRLRGQSGMGWGDIKMLGLLGAFLGWRSGIVAVALASVTAATAGVMIVLAGWMRASRQTAAGAFSETALPFGIFLAGGGAVALVWGPMVWHWWIG